MMQFTKSILFTLLILGITTAEQQIKAQGIAIADIDAVTSATGQVYEEVYPGGTLSYSGRMTPRKALAFITKFNFYHVAGATPGRGSYNMHKTFPTVIDGGVTALVTTEKQQFSFLAHGLITPSANKIGFPVLFADNNIYMEDSLSHRAGLQLSPAYILEGEKLGADLTVQYEYKSFEHLMIDRDGFYDEADIYLQSKVHALLWDQQIYAGGMFNAKHDLNTYNAYNWLNAGVLAGSAIKLHKGKTQLYSTVTLTSLEGDIIEKKYATGLTGAVNFRLLQKIKKKFWIKSNMDMMIRDNAMKGQWGGSFRAVHKRLSAESGFWATRGALFPRHCGWARGTVHILKNRLELEPGMKHYWIKKESTNEYHRSDFTMNFNFRPLEQRRKLTLTMGSLWRIFNNSPTFSTGGEFFLGVETVM